MHCGSCDQVIKPLLPAGEGGGGGGVAFDESNHALWFIKSCVYCFGIVPGDPDRVLQQFRQRFLKIIL